MAASSWLPSWVADSYDQLAAKYADALRLEIAYQYFIDHYADYQADIEENTIEFKDVGEGAGAITNLEQAKKALGPAEDGGSSWLAMKTSWRKFGLFTGFHMNFLRECVLNDPEEAGFWASLFNTGGAQEAAQELSRREDPIYPTEVAGSAEPGGGQAITAKIDMGVGGLPDPWGGEEPPARALRMKMYMKDYTREEAEIWDLVYNARVGTPGFVEDPDRPGYGTIMAGNSFTAWATGTAGAEAAADSEQVRRKADWATLPPDEKKALEDEQFHRRFSLPIHEGRRRNEYGLGRQRRTSTAGGSRARAQAGSAQGVGDPERITAAKTNLFWKSPLQGENTATSLLGYGDAGIEINNFFTDTSTALDETTPAGKAGHFTSPEIMEFTKLGGRVPPEVHACLKAFREELSSAAINVAGGADGPLALPEGVSINDTVWKAEAPFYYSYTGEGWDAFESANRTQHLPAPFETSRKKGEAYIPDRVAIWPTLPLGDFAASAAGEFKDDIAMQWELLYAAFVAPGEAQLAGGTLAPLDKFLRESFLARDGTGSLFGANKGTPEYDAKVQEYVEQILDFFGAGKITEQTEAQERDEGGDITLDDDVKEEVRKKIKKVRNLKPFDFQCFLVENIGLLSSFQEKEANYSNVIPLTGNGVAPGSTVSTIQMGGKVGQIEELLNLTPAAYAMLVPYIKIYRVDYDPENPTKAIKQQEIPIPNFIEPADIERLTGKGGGRFGGWGLQSFTWGLDGIQPAEVDNNISATLSFYFQTIEDLFKGSAAHSELAGGTQYQAGTGVPNPLDLLIPSPTIKKFKSQPAGPVDLQPTPAFLRSIMKDNLNQGFNGPSYRIKVVAGWSTPPNSSFEATMPDSSPAKLKQLRQAIDSTRISLFLQQTRHNLTFNEDGSLNLTIDYQAALTGMLTSNRMDILGNNTKATQNILKPLEEKMMALSEEIEEGGGFEDDAATEGDQAARMNAKKEDLKKLLQKRKDLLEQDKLKKYRRFLARLYGRTADNEPIEGGPKVYSMQVNPRELYMPPLWQETPERRAQRARNKLSGDSEARGFVLSAGGSEHQNTDLLQLIVDENSEDGGATTGEQLYQQWTESLGESEQIYIPYFYLGDLIDSIIESNPDINSESPVRNYMTFLAEIDVIDPLVWYQLGNATAVKAADTINEAALIEQLQAKGYLQGIDPEEGGALKKRINIGSIPISMDQFNIWFKNNVVQAGKGSYMLIQFIKDLCAQLITDSLRSSCYDKDAENMIKFDTSIVQFHNKRAGGSPKMHPGRPAAVGILASASGVSGPTNDIPPPDASEEDKNKFDLTSGLLIYCTDAGPGFRDGDYSTDLSQGIYHHYIGASAGLLKKLSFNRQDQQYLRESKIQKRGTLGAEQLRELYTVNLEMVGNTLYKNGQYIYIDPTFVGGAADLSRILGLGGYFMVSSVHHTISPSGYNVTLQAYQEGMRFREEAVSTTAQLLEGVSDEIIDERPDWRPDDDATGDDADPIPTVFTPEELAAATEGASGLETTTVMIGSVQADIEGGPLSEDQAATAIARSSAEPGAGRTAGGESGVIIQKTRVLMR